MRSLQEMKKQHDLSARLKLIIFAVSIVIGFALFLILHYASDLGATKSLGIGLTVFFMLFGLSYAVLAALVKDGWSYVAGSIALVAGVIVLLSMVVGVKWYIWILSALVLAIVLVILLVVAVLPKLSIVAKNDDPEYKDYKQRRQEKEAMQQPEEEPLPELKSFKKEQ